MIPSLPAPVVPARHVRPTAFAAALLLAALLAAHPVPAAPSGDAGAWPRVIYGRGNRLYLYEPQVDAWRGDRIEWRNVAAIKLLRDKEPRLGVLRMEASLELDLPSRLARLSSIRVRDAAMVAGDAAPIDPEVALDTARELIGAAPLVLSLDLLLAGAARSVDLASLPATPVENAPPRIFVSDRDAMLLQFDGEPSLVGLPGTGLMAVRNTNANLLFQPTESAWFLWTGEARLTALSLDGPWAAPKRLPEGLPVMKPAEEKRFTATRPPPSIFAAREPAELLLLDGPARMAPVPGTELLFARNASHPLFIHRGENVFYLLLAGRWFRSEDLKGGWTFATPELPGDFRAIPKEHPAGSVRASVPGTPEAARAALLAAVPGRARISRELARLEVVYDGPPEFAPIEWTSLRRALNTPFDLVASDSGFFCCESGVWFRADRATGPWSLADSIPSAIESIPPGDPLHRLTFTRVVEADERSVVFSCAGGYDGAFLSGGVVVFGDGRAHPAWRSATAWYGQPTTYGWGAILDPSSGSYVRRYGDLARGLRAKDLDPWNLEAILRDRAEGPFDAWEAAATPANEWAVGLGIGDDGSSKLPELADLDPGFQSSRDVSDEAGRGGPAPGGRPGEVGLQTSRGFQPLVVADGSHGVFVASASGDGLFAGPGDRVFRRESGRWSVLAPDGWRVVPGGSPGIAAAEAPGARENGVAARNPRPATSASASGDPSGYAPRSSESDSEATSAADRARIARAGREFVEALVEREREQDRVASSSRLEQVRRAERDRLAALRAAVAEADGEQLAAAEESLREVAPDDVSTSWSRMATDPVAEDWARMQRGLIALEVEALAREELELPVRRDTDRPRPTGARSVTNFKPLSSHATSAIQYANPTRQMLRGTGGRKGAIGGVTRIK